jgi:uncharacterized cupin superfamily protein
MTARTVGSGADWPEAESIAVSRVISGAPAAQTVVTATTAAGETGFWRVTQGEFTTAHEGYIEFFHIVEGEGELVHDDGTVLALAPGVTVTMDDGWCGRWVVREPLVKTYAILRTAS